MSYSKPTPRQTYRKDLTPVVAEALAAFTVGFFVVAVLFALLLSSGCVTRTTVCVEAAHGLGARDAYGARPDSAGASVCAELEPPTR